MELFEKIKQIRGEKGLSQKELAEQAGLNIKLISKYETNTITPKLESLKKIARVLGVTTDYLLYDDVPKDGVTTLKDTKLFEKFKIIETMDEGSRKTIENVIDAVIVKNQVEGVIIPHLNK